MTTLGYPFAHVNRVFRPLTLGQISPSGSLLYPQKRPFPPRITYFTHPEPRLHFPRHQTVTESHSEDFIIEFGVACLSCLTPHRSGWRPPRWQKPSLKVPPLLVLLLCPYPAATSRRSTTRSPKPSPLEPELQGAKSRTARTQ